MAHPARSLPPLSFGDPELDAPANDTAPPVDAFVQLPTLTFADTAPPRVSRAEPPPAEAVYEVPSIIPEAAKDPSFEASPPATPSWMSQTAQPANDAQTTGPIKLPDLTPAPAELDVEERVVELLERLFERLPPWPDALRVKVSASAAFAIALVALWFELGFAVRTTRAFFTASMRLFE